MEWDHAPARLPMVSSPPSAALHPRAQLSRCCSGWFSGVVSQQGSPSPAESTTMDSLVSATGDNPASGTVTPALQELFKGSGFPASCQNQGVHLAPPVKPKIIPPAAASPP